MDSFIDIVGGVRIRRDELRFRFSRSGGPGGQHVNKVSTRVELHFDVDGSPSLQAHQKSLIRKSLSRRVGGDGILRLQVQESRSQWQNRRDAVEKLVALLQSALKPAKKRTATRPSASSREVRFRRKKRRGAVKKSRTRVSADE
ncbi:MAG: alternative ribosome rescue aminoacyl-tRNA hydrolase ArfB [Bacteroidota bacterium]